MCVVSHGYGGFGEGKNAGSGWDGYGTNTLGLGCMPGDAGALFRVRGNTLVTTDNTAIKVRSSGYYRAGIGWSSCEGLKADATRRLRFVVHYTGWLHSMLLHGRRC